MKDHPTKKYPTIGVCGIDCGLCPRYYTVGPSRCPGCLGPEFFSKHPSCSFITCCVKKNNLEVCAECEEFPCQKFAGEGEGENAYDSFVTHRKTISNLGFIRDRGIGEFINHQKKRIELLGIMLRGFDEGRSKSFYCTSATLLSIEGLEKSLDDAKQKINVDKIKSGDIKTKAKILRGILNGCALGENVELKLRRK